MRPFKNKIITQAAIESLVRGLTSKTAYMHNMYMCMCMYMHNMYMSCAMSHVHEQLVPQ